MARAWGHEIIKDHCEFPISIICDFTVHKASSSNSKSDLRVVLFSIFLEFCEGMYSGFRTEF